MRYHYLHRHTAAVSDLTGFAKILSGLASGFLQEEGLFMFAVFLIKRLITAFFKNHYNIKYIKTIVKSIVFYRISCSILEHPIENYGKTMELIVK